MHILTLDRRLELLAETDVIEPGSYLMEDENAGQLMVLAGRGEMRPVADRGDEVPTLAPVGSNVLFLRVGGFGDLILLTPVLREHKRQFPNAKIGVCCFPHYACVLEGLPYVDKIVPYPLPLDTANKWDRWVFLEKVIEGNPRAQEVHITDIFAEHAGITLEDKKPDYALKPSESLWAFGQYPRNAKKRACIQVGASARIRRYPLAMVGEVARGLIGRGWEVFLMGARGELPPKKKEVTGLRDLTADGLTFRQSCAVLNTADVVIAPDSALAHVAGALDVPAVGLYGPFHWKVRTAYSPSITAIQGNNGCAPCYHHVNQGRQDHFPKHCPSAQHGFCQVLASIQPDRVVALAEKVARTVPVSSL